MNKILDYYDYLVDEHGFIHSIDMVTIEYDCKFSPSVMMSKLQEFANRFHPIDCDIYERGAHKKYGFYQWHCELDGAYISCGKYKQYDKATKIWSITPLLLLRVNPNKHYEKAWFMPLFALINECCDNGTLKKFDYAVDVPLTYSLVDVADSRKSTSRMGTTRYWGKAGAHGYLKIYDKVKESKLESDLPLTRIEHTLFADKPFSLEKIVLIDPNTCNSDLSGLKGTDRVIIELYYLAKNNGLEYEGLSQLGRDKRTKLKSYLVGNSVALDYGNYLPLLIDSLKKSLSFESCDLIITDLDGFVTIDDSSVFDFDDI